MHEVGDIIRYVNTDDGDKHRCVVLHRILRSEDEPEGYKFLYVIRSIEDDYGFTHDLEGYENVNRCIGLYLEKDDDMKPCKTLTIHELWTE